MTKTRKKKMRAKRIVAFRHRNEIDRCTCCGRLLNLTAHHFLCGECWNYKEKYPFEWRKYYQKKHAKMMREQRVVIPNENI